MAAQPGDRFRNHWRPRPGGVGTTVYLSWFLLPPPGGALHALADRYDEALGAHPVLAVVPAPWRHLTVQGLGPAIGDVDAVVAATRHRLAGVGPISLRFGPAAVHLEGVLLEGAPAAPVARLRAALRAAAREVLDVVPGADDEPVWPHLSLAYAGGDEPVDPVLAAMSVVPAEPVTETFGAVSLVDLRRVGRAYTWTVVARVPLGG